MSRDKQEYLKYKPFADDLRKAESWCELDGVLNRYQTVKNLSKMGYRKASEVASEIFADLDKALGELAMKYSDEGFNEYFGVCEVVFRKALYPIKKKYAEGEREEDAERSKR